MKTLITGFKSKENNTNASETLICSYLENLPRSLKNLSGNLELLLVNDNTHSIKSELETALHKFNPDFCIFVGQAPGYNRVTLETIATNYRFISPPPKIGDPPTGDVIEKEGAAAYKATLPDFENIISQIKNAGIPASLSHNCGNSLCNQILYHGLHYAKVNQKNIKCGFFHIPALPDQVITQWPQHPFMPLEMSSNALEVVVNSLYE